MQVCRWVLSFKGLESSKNAPYTVDEDWNECNKFVWIYLWDIYEYLKCKLEIQPLSGPQFNSHVGLRLQ